MERQNLWLPFLLGLAAFLWWKKSQAKPLTTDEPAEPDEPPPPMPPASMANFVGHPDFKWPHQDKFPLEETFVGVLANLGYNAGPIESGVSVLSDRNRSVVRQFQRDYNAVRKADYEGKNLLDVDGLIGKFTIGGSSGGGKTATGLIFAQEVSPIIFWLDAVGAARAKLEVQS